MGLINWNPEPTWAGTILTRFIRRGGEVQIMEHETQRTRAVPKPGGGFNYHTYGLELTVPASIRRLQEQQAAAKAVPAAVVKDSGNNAFPISRARVNVVSQRRRPIVTKATIRSRSKLFAKIQSTQDPVPIPLLPKPPGLIAIKVPTFSTPPPVLSVVEDYDLTLGNLLNANAGFVPWKLGETAKRPLPRLVSAKPPEPEVIDLSDSEDEVVGNDPASANEVLINSLAGEPKGTRGSAPPQTYRWGRTSIELPPGIDISEVDVSDEFDAGSSGGHNEEDAGSSGGQNEEESNGTQFLQWGESTIAIPDGLEMSEVEEEEIFAEDEEIIDEEGELFQEDVGHVELSKSSTVEQTLTMEMGMLSDPTVGFGWEDQIENGEDMKMLLQDGHGSGQNIMALKKEN